MGKPIANSLIPQKENIEKLLSETNICKVVCTISYEDLENDLNKQELLKKVKDYYNSTHSNNSEKIQSGRVWFLAKKQDDFSEILQVAQSIDYDYKEKKGFFYEIRGHIEEMF